MILHAVQPTDTEHVIGGVFVLQGHDGAQAHFRMYFDKRTNELLIRSAKYRDQTYATIREIQANPNGEPVVRGEAVRENNVISREQYEYEATASATQEAFNQSQRTAMLRMQEQLAARVFGPNGPNIWLDANGTPTMRRTTEWSTDNVTTTGLDAYRTDEHSFRLQADIDNMIAQTTPVGLGTGTRIQVRASNDRTPNREGVAIS